jgi:hypothetical protein
LRKFWSEQAKQKAGVVQSPPKPDPPVVSALTPQPQIAPQQKQQQSQPQQPPQQPLLQHGAKSVMGTSMVGASAAVKDPRRLFVDSWMPYELVTQLSFVFVFA